MIKLAAILICLPTIALSHDWYPWECCSSIDCAPVPDGTVEEKADGVHVKGFGVLQHGDPKIKISKDDQEHLCVSIQTKALLCVFKKPTGF